VSEDEPRASHEAERLGPAPPVPAVATEDTGSLRRLLGVATIDLTPLRRHRDYRLLFAGQALSFFGAMLTYVAIPFQVYHLTGSPLALGLLSLAELVPLLFTAFIGGALADAVDRRRMLQLAEAALGLATVILFFNSLLDEPKVWVLFVVAPLLATRCGESSG
jgi:MFS family permease